MMYSVLLYYFQFRGITLQIRAMPVPDPEPDDPQKFQVRVFRIFASSAISSILPAVTVKM